MDVKTLEEALTLQKEFTAQLLKGLKALAGGKTPSPEILIHDNHALLSAAQANLEIAVAQRDEAVRRWDAEIARRKTALESLTRETDEITRQPVARARRSQRGSRPGRTRTRRDR